MMANHDGTTSSTTSTTATTTNTNTPLNVTILPKLLPVSQFLAGKAFENRDDETLPPLSSEVVIFHNNFCDLGCSKVKRAKVLGLWHPVELEAIMG
jgi:hypothetical protein